MINTIIPDKLKGGSSKQLSMQKGYYRTEAPKHNILVDKHRVMLQDFKMLYIYLNSHINFKLSKR
jgi:hypothetical protein